MSFLFTNCDLNSDMVLLDNSFYIDRFEASVYEKIILLSDGTTKTEEYAVSLQNKIPKTDVSYETAKNLCEKSGKRLCSTHEWITACKGKDVKKFGFQDEHDKPRRISEICVTGKGKDDAFEPTGSRTACHPNGINAYDFVGNVSEWTYLNDSTGSLFGVSYVGGVAIGSNYDSVDDLSGCSFVLLSDTNGDGIDDYFISQSTKSPFLGFRCCKDAN